MLEAMKAVVKYKIGFKYWDRQLKAAFLDLPNWNFFHGSEKMMVLYTLIASETVDFLTGISVEEIKPLATKNFVFQCGAKWKTILASFLNLRKIRTQMTAKKDCLIIFCFANIWKFLIENFIKDSVPVVLWIDGTSRRRILSETKDLLVALKIRTPEQIVSFGNSKFFTGLKVKF